jgi:hypothetical protein
MLATKVLHETLCHIVQYHDTRFLVLREPLRDTNPLRLICGESNSGMRCSQSHRSWQTSFSLIPALTLKRPLVLGAESAPFR